MTTDPPMPPRERRHKSTGDDVFAYDPDLALRAPMPGPQLREIKAHMDKVWDEADYHRAGQYANALFIEVMRLTQEARQREEELAAARNVVLHVAILRDRLQDLLLALGNGDGS